jgi:hypothetical protein
VTMSNSTLFTTPNHTRRRERVAALCPDTDAYFQVRSAQDLGPAAA